MKNSHLVAPVFLAGDYHLPQMQSAPYVIVTNGADRFTLYSNFLPIDRCGEGDVAGDVEVVGESAAVYLFGQAVVTGREVEQADMAIDGGGAVGGYGAQDGGEAEVLGEGNLLPVTVSLAFDGVLLSVVHIVVVGVNDPRLHHGVDSRDAFVDDDEAQGVCTGHGLGAVRSLFRICYRLPCRLTARGECEGGNQEEEKFCLVHIACDFIIRGSVSTKADNCPNKREFIVGYARSVRHGCLCSGSWWH